MSPSILSGEAMVPGHAEGDVLWSDVPLSVWMGIDVRTGEILDAHHPLRGANVAGRIFALPSGRGSCSGSLGLLELILAGKAPAAVVLEHADPILALGSIIGDEVFGQSIPILVVGPERFAALRGEEHAIVDAVARRAGDALALEPGDRAMLAGAEGQARQVAMRIVVRMARMLGAPALTTVTQAHLDGCFYTGPGGLAFVERMRDWGGALKVPTTTNATSVDGRLWRSQAIDPVFGAAAERIVAAYTGLGARPTFTCAPYLLPSAPRLGEQIAWGESNAVAFANSVLGARTMKYPDLLDVCVALTGRAPLTDSHTDAGRRPAVRIDVAAPAGLDDAFWPTLGHLVGELAAQHIPLVTGLEQTSPSLDDLKAFAAAFATTASAPLFHIRGVTPEAGGFDAAPLRAITVTAADLAHAWAALDAAPARAVDLVALGNPHFSLAEFETAAALSRGHSKASSVTVMVTCGRDIHARAEEAGFVADLEAFGAQVLVDTCWCMIEEPVLPRPARTIMTNSGKYAHYAPGLTGRALRFGSLAACLEAARTGLAPERPPAWVGERSAEAAR